MMLVGLSCTARPPLPTTRWRTSALQRGSGCWQIDGSPLRAAGFEGAPQNPQGTREHPRSFPSQYTETLGAQKKFRC